MSVQSDYNDDTKYCTVDDVARYFEEYDTFDAGTDPTAGEVEESIADWSTYIDRETQHAFRENRVVDETHDQRHLYYWLTGHPLNLLKRDLRDLDHTKGDKLEVWTGNEWEEWLSDPVYTQGRDEDYWLDKPVGQLWVFERAFISPHPKFRLTYRYGKEFVPKDIRMACAKLVAQDLVHGDFYGTMVPGNNNSGNADPTEAAKMWYQQAHNTIDNYRELVWL